MSALAETEEAAALKLIKYIKVIGALAGVLISAATVVAGFAYRLGSDMASYRYGQETTNKELVALRTEVSTLTKRLDQRQDALRDEIWASFKITNWDCHPTPVRGVFRDCVMRRPK